MIRKLLYFLKHIDNHNQHKPCDVVAVYNYNIDSVQLSMAKEAEN